MVRPVAVYTLLRVALFVGSLGVVSLLGVRGFVAVVGALVLSAVLSAVLLKRQRDAIAEVAAARRAERAAEKERLQARLRDEG